mmetsp:Transcript_1856/g.8269  ORF Transcript_1856/g.8269 Transcript_1856/m.8269 type:complete len:212 (-) Transcript_1856:496-1131(-)
MRWMQVMAEACCVQISVSFLLSLPRFAIAWNRARAAETPLSAWDDDAFSSLTSTILSKCHPSEAPPVKTIGFISWPPPTMQFSLRKVRQLSGSCPNRIERSTGCAPPKCTTCRDESWPQYARASPLGDQQTPCTQPWQLNSAYTSPKGITSAKGPLCCSASTPATKAEITRHLKSVDPVAMSCEDGCQLKQVTVDLCFLTIFETHQSFSCS